MRLRSGARFARSGIACILVAVLALASTPVFAAAESSAAKGGATLLADRHASRSLACNSCHAEDPPSKAVGTAKCQGCHGNHEKLAQRTEKVEPNPHQSHQGPMDCASCHHAHKASEDACSRCHVTSYKVP